MQSLRNLFFYWSPVLGAIIGGLVGLSFNKFTAVIEALIGFGGGCIVSALMIVLSIRARFKSDVTLTHNKLSGSASAEAKSETK